NSTDRVVFNRPLGDSLDVEPGTSSTESSSGSSTVTPVGSDTGTVEPSSGGLGTVTTPSSSSFSTAAPDTSAPAPAPVAAPPTQPAVAPVVAPVRAVTGTGGDTPVAPLVFAGLAVLAIGLWVFASRTG